MGMLASLTFGSFISATDPVTVLAVFQALGVKVSPVRSNFPILLPAGDWVGCVDLLKAIKTRVKPLVHVFGHVHEDWGATHDGTTTFVNSSTCTLRYRPDNPCIIVDVLPEEGLE